MAQALDAAATVQDRVDARSRSIGILLLLGAVTCFACLDGVGKWVNRTTDPTLTAAIRYLLSFVFMSVFINPWNKPGIARTQTLWLQCARALCLLVATLASFYAVRRLPLTQATSITFLAPLLVAVIAGPLLGEWIGWRRLVAVLVGFAGVLVVTRPGSGAFQPAMLLAVLVAIANAFYALSTRILAGRDSSATTMFYSGLVGSIVFLPVLPFVWVTPDSTLKWIALAALGGFGALGHWLLILAHRRAPASVLAPFFYAQLIGAAVVGLLLFGEVPDRWTVAGGSIVISSGLYLLYRERVRRLPPSADIAA